MYTLRRILLAAGFSLLLLPGGARAGAPAPVSTSSPEAAPASSLVLVVRDQEATEAFRARIERVREMVSRGIMGVTGKGSPSEAWRALVTTQDVVGIKVHSAPGLAGTRPEVAAAIAEGLIAAGVPPKQIVVWDKLQANLQTAGFVQLAKELGIRVLSGQQAGYDEMVAYTNSVLGHLMWTDREFNKTGDDIGRRSFYTRLLTHEVTKIINVAPLINHYRAGTAGCLYSLAMGSVDNTQRFEATGERLAEAVPEIYVQEPILDKVVLHVVDALLAQYEGESQTLLHYAQPMNELRFSHDPVALDVLSLQELESLRQSHGIPGSTNFVAAYRRLYQDNAPLLELGSADPKKIRVERK